VVVGRVSAFADPVILELTKTKLIPVCTDDWYTRRRQDAEGDFFRSVANQGPRKGEGGATRQGIYLFTAAGKLLSFKNNGGNVEETRKQILKALEDFDKLPAAEKTANVPPAGKSDPNYDRPLPKDGLVLRVHARILEKKNDLKLFDRGTCTFQGGDRASRDFLWLNADETRSISPLCYSVGQAYEIPNAIRQRVARFHLIDNTRGEPELWKRNELHECRMVMVVDAVDGDLFRIRLEGHTVLATDAMLSEAKRGYECKIHGECVFNAKTKQWVKFDVAAVGDHWGRSTYTPGNRPGRMPLGITFEIADTTRPGNRIPPQAAREWRTYWGKD
jgi:hypothetical protein